MTMPFDVTVRDVADPDLGPLLTRLSAAGYPDPLVRPAGAPRESSVEGSNGGDLPDSWSIEKDLEPQTYRWPEYEETYERYLVFEAITQREGTVRIALGFAPRAQAWGKDREYVVAFLTSGAPQTPLCEFLETDDYDVNGQMLAVIRGREGGRRMYGPADPLPEVYEEHFETAVYRDLVRVSGSWNKMAVVVDKTDFDAMLNHALVQARRRGDL